MRCAACPRGGASLRLTIARRHAYTYDRQTELPGAIEAIAAKFGLPTVNVSRVAGVDAKAGGAYKSLAATKRAALPDELWAWAAPHLSPRYEALRRR